jgi:tetratricopeptide (TPR) repeat protein
MIGRPLISAASLLLACILAGCSTTKSGNDGAAPSASSSTPVAVPVAKSPAQRFQSALDLLQNGQPRQADEELHAYLKEVPGSEAAHSLVAQIETPLDKLFPAENFHVTLTRDESLSSLAKTYLGDAMRFYALARYNGIPVPAKVNAGQTIKSPATPFALAAAKAGTANAAEEEEQVAVTPTPRPKRPAAEVWNDIKTDVRHHRYEEAAALADAEAFMPNNAQAATVAGAYAACASAEREHDQARSSGCAIKAGRLYLETGKPAKAMNTLEIALALSPGDAEAKALYREASRKIADKAYKDGMIAFQRQDLDGAIAAWDKVLALDPDHKDAQLNRAQALKLKENLKKLRH